ILEAIRRGSSVCGGLYRVRAGEAGLFAGADLYSRIVTCSLTIAFADSNPSLVVIGPDCEHVHTGLHHGEGGIGSVDLENFAGLEMNDSEFEDTLIEFSLHGVVAHVGEGETGLGVHAKEAVADVEFGA